MLVTLPAVVVHVRRPEVAGECFDGFADVAHQVGMAVIEADADVHTLEILLDQPRQRGCAG
jgi:hypothetical protein